MYSDDHVIWDNVPLHQRNDYMINAPERFLNLMKLGYYARPLRIFDTPNEVDLRSIILSKPILNLDSFQLYSNEAHLSNLIYDGYFLVQDKIPPIYNKGYRRPLWQQGQNWA